ncbi:hypothetical protein GFY24_00645 [Nocardia sp. SYP-A9097]|uniref:hypothetical protein n=1 Tax=Nocardia sp. SYP-A9097 TaxID=2663237 RepID=UPI00129A2B15|nr:hypothetical protein [Nocardia sp. SYP-A9097]MRH85985.1 hypothetical protein [Nocardia sp. SYP-A9097]
MSPEQITAIGGIVAALLGTATAWQGRRIAELQSRLDKVETQLEDSNELVREAIRYIRKLLKHHDEVEMAWRLGVPPPLIPEIPALLAKEI